MIGQVFLRHHSLLLTQTTTQRSHPGACLPLPPVVQTLHYTLRSLTEVVPRCTETATMGMLSTFIGVYPHGLVLPPPTDPLYIAFVQALATASGRDEAYTKRRLKQLRNGNTDDASLTDSDMEDSDMEEDEAKDGVANAAAAASAGSDSGVGGASSQGGSTQKPLILDDVLEATLNFTKLMSYLVARYTKPWNDLGAAILRMFPSIPLVELHFDYEDCQGFFMRKLAPNDRPMFRLSDHDEPRFFVKKREVNAAPCVCESSGNACECLVLDQKQYWDFVDNHRDELDRVFHVVEESPIDVHDLLFTESGYLRPATAQTNALKAAILASIMARFSGGGY